MIGHSLGGMVEQQLMADKALKNNYKILNVVAMGSPYILTKESKEGTLRRPADSRDVIPFVNIPLLTCAQYSSLAVECTTEGFWIHLTSYPNGAAWQKYDALGFKNGNTTIDLNTVVYAA